MTLARSAALVAVVTVIVVLVPGAPANASGGGGCGRPVTNQSGTEVEIEDLCFLPTVLFAEPGDTVTWTNVDPYFHNVGGANMAWGSFERMREGRSVSYSFAEPGVYSYVCTMHPGMVGTVVVGDPVPGGATDTSSVRRIKPVSAVQPDPAPRGGSGDATFWLVASATVVALSAMLVGRRVRRRIHA